MLGGRDAAAPEDVRAVLPAVMRHRILPSYLARAEGVDEAEIVRRVAAAVPAPDGWSPAPPVRRRSLLDRVLRR
jgi:MoxR-like ATPase